MPTRPSSPSRQEPTWYVYLLQRSDRIEDFRASQGNRSTYVGISNDVMARLADHNSGRARSTRGHHWLLKAMLAMPSRHEAAVLEQWLKCGDSSLKRLSFLYACSVTTAVYPERISLIIKRAFLWWETRKVRQSYGNPKPFSPDEIGATSLGHKDNA